MMQHTAIPCILYDTCARVNMDRVGPLFVCLGSRTVSKCIPQCQVLLRVPLCSEGLGLVSEVSSFNGKGKAAKRTLQDLDMLKHVEADFH